MDTNKLAQAHEDFLAIAERETFGAPPPGEWTVEQLLAHMALADLSIASTALAVAAGQRPSYDNRTTLDGWALQRLIDRAADLPGLITMVRDAGATFVAVAASLTDDDLDTPIRVLIISNDVTGIDDTLPLRFLVDGIGEFHLPRHADQLRSLIAPAPDE